MQRFTNCFRFLFISFLSISLTSCATKPVSKSPLPFNVAVKALTNNLLGQVKKKSLIKLPLEKIIVMDDFTDEDTGEFVAASDAIEKIILAEAKQKFSRFTITKINKNNIKDAHYLINGIISLEKIDALSDDKNYHLVASVTDLKSGEVIANSAAWISDKDLDYSPLREYKEAPMYMTDKRHKGKVITARSLSGKQADIEYFKTLETNALIAEAATAYDQANYPLVISMLTEAASRPDGDVMKTYALLYQAYFKEGNGNAAEEAFGKLVALSVQNNSLSVKLLFGVNTTDYIADTELKARYQLWIRQISKYFNDNKNQCVKIIGHSSKTGSDDYNIRLSKSRADAVQRQMIALFKGIKSKTETEGMGFKNNIKGLGTDDGRDAIDRRVEFFVKECV